MTQHQTMQLFSGDWRARAAVLPWQLHCNEDRRSGHEHTGAVDCGGKRGPATDRMPRALAERDGFCSYRVFDARRSPAPNGLSIWFNSRSRPLSRRIFAVTVFTMTVCIHPHNNRYRTPWWSSVKLKRSNVLYAVEALSFYCSSLRTETLRRILMAIFDVRMKMNMPQKRKTSSVDPSQSLGVRTWVLKNIQDLTLLVW